MSAPLSAFGLTLDATNNSAADRHAAAARLLLIAQQAMIGAEDIIVIDAADAVAELVGLARQLIVEPGE